MPSDWFDYLKRKVISLGGLGLSAALHRHMGTLDYQGYYYDPTIDPNHRDFRGPTIVLFWHEYIPFLFYLRGHNDIAMLLSQHRDAEWLAEAARFCGFETIRGSSKRGAVAALREILAHPRLTLLSVTPDGPTGPRRKLAPGPIFLSSRLGVPLVAFGLGYDRPWRLSTWDRFAVPRPFSRARGVAGPRIQIPPDVDREGLERYRQSVERTLNALTDEAERWAESGDRREGSVRMHCRPRPPLYDRDVSPPEPAAPRSRVWRESA